MYRIMFSIYFDLFAYPSCFDAFCMHILTFSCLPFVRSDRTVESDRRTADPPPTRRPDDPTASGIIALLSQFGSASLVASSAFALTIDNRLPSWEKGHKI